MIVTLLALAAVQPPAMSIAISPDTGACTVEDRSGGVTWRSSSLGEAVLIVAGKPRRVALGKCDVVRGKGLLTATVHPLPDLPAATIEVRLQPTERTVTVSYVTSGGLTVESIRLLGDMLQTSGNGYVVVPVREGLLIPADSGLAFSHDFDTFAYEGCHMEMLGVVRDGAAALVTWHDPYVVANVRSTLGQPAQTLTASLNLRRSARAFRLHFLGKGDYVAIAKAYRAVAKQKGWLVTWREKLKTNPTAARYFGAVDYKLWSALDRRMSEDSKTEEAAHVNWTFDEAAQVAEHLKTDLQLERVLFMVGGWIHRGYDNQHPDVLPAAPECGGDAALADCAKRVKKLGYLFCLHDNYQDMYRDAPSWDERFLMKTPDGKPAVGGHWAGGRAYVTCAKMAVELAKRPQNLAAVKKLTGADSYFIDTTYAAGLQECFDPAHPLTRWDDMRWKQAISDYARAVFGTFGSECGREWAIPHSDFFEGLTGVSGNAYHDAGLPARLGATVVPLFELVYRDCIAMYGKYGYDQNKAAVYVLQHIALGRPLNYHSVPGHLYWKAQPARPPLSAPKAGGDPALFTCAENSWYADKHPMDRFVKTTYELLSPLYEITAQMPMTGHRFLTPDRKVQRSTFGEGPSAVTVVVNSGTDEFTCRLPTAGDVTLPAYGFVIDSPAFVAEHALGADGKPAMWTARADQPLKRATNVRIFRIFGDGVIRVAGHQWRPL